MNAGSTPTPARPATKCRRAKPYTQRTGETIVDWCDLLMSTIFLPFYFYFRGIRGFNNLLFLGGKHRIPRRQEHGLLTQYLLDLGGDVFLVDHHAEEIFVKPSVGHDEMAVVAPEPQLFSTIHLRGLPLSSRSTATRVMAWDDALAWVRILSALSMPKRVPKSDS